MPVFSGRKLSGDVERKVGAVRAGRRAMKAAGLIRPSGAGEHVKEEIHVGNTEAPHSPLAASVCQSPRTTRYWSRYRMPPGYLASARP